MSYCKIHGGDFVHIYKNEQGGFCPGGGGGGGGGGGLCPYPISLLCYIFKYISCELTGFRRRFFVVFFLHEYKSIDAIDPRSMASLDPRRLIGRIYVGDHKLVH